MTKVIGLAGMPRARKTSLAQDLKDFLYYEKGKSVRLYPETALVCPLPKEKKESFHIWSINSVINQVLEAKFTKDYDVAIIDRGIFDRQAFTLTMGKLGNLPSNLAESTFEYTSYFSDLEDLVVLFLTDPLKSYETASVKSTSSSTRNPAFLSALYDSYRQLLPGLHHKPLVFEKDYEPEMLQEIVEKIL